MITFIDKPLTLIKLILGEINGPRNGHKPSSLLFLCPKFFEIGQASENGSTSEPNFMVILLSCLQRCDSLHCNPFLVIHTK